MRDEGDDRPGQPFREPRFLQHWATLAAMHPIVANHDKNLHQTILESPKIRRSGETSLLSVWVDGSSSGVVFNKRCDHQAPIPPSQHQKAYQPDSLS
jgi:hypothetical protein